MMDLRTLTENFKFQISPDHEKMTDPLPSLKILNFRFGQVKER